MNIEDLTIGEAKKLAAMFAGETREVRPAHPFVGKFCIARCYAAGVHAGVVVSVDGENVILSDSRRLWSWKAKDGVALSGLAVNGLSSGKVDVLMPIIYLTGVCELLPCSELVKESIYAAK